RYLAAGLASLIGALALPIAVHAQPPAGAANVWTPQAIGMEDCVQRAKTALQSAGGTNVEQKIIFSGMAFVRGYLGDYHAMIMCITFKGVVVVTVHGADGATAEDYRAQLNRGMGVAR